MDMKKTKLLCRWLPVFAIGMLSMTAPAQADDGNLSAKDLAALLAKASIQCDDATGNTCTAGNVDTGDFYDVAISGDCYSNAYYGRIGSQPVEARDKVATTGTGSKTIVELPANQMVCILAAASAGRGKTDMEYYVMALPFDYDESCMGNNRCRKPLPKPPRSHAGLQDRP